MRLFIGSRFSDRTGDEVARLLEFAGARLGRAVSWTPKDGLHLTWAFLGEVFTEAGIPALGKCLDETAAGERRIKVSLGGLGAFPSLERPRVLWLGFPEGSPGLRELAAKLAEGLRGTGFIAESVFVPHLTLGRVKSVPDPAGLAAVAEKAAGMSLRDEISSLELVESRLTGQGARHRTLHTSLLL